jgi:hypothetical protein
MYPTGSHPASRTKVSLGVRGHIPSPQHAHSRPNTPTHPPKRAALPTININALDNSGRHKEAGRGPRRAESGRCLRNVSPSPAVYRLSGDRPRSEMGESSSAPRAADSQTGAAHRLGAGEAHPGEQRVRVRAEHDHDPLDLGHRGLGGDRLLEQRPTPRGSASGFGPLRRAGARRQDQTCIQAAAS